MNNIQIYKCIYRQYFIFLLSKICLTYINIYSITPLNLQIHEYLHLTKTPWILIISKC